MGKQNPAWLQEAREFCRNAGIEILAWGPDMLTVEAKSEDRAKEIESQLGQLGFKVIKDEDDAYAGLLSLSKNPAAVQAKIASFDISRRRWNERIVPVIWALGTLFLVPSFSGSARRTLCWLCLPLGVLAAIMFFRDCARIWGWSLEMLPEGLRIRRYYRWSTIPWKQINGVESASAFGRDQEAVVLKLKSGASEGLGSFNFAFARNLRDRLRIEVAQRRGEPA